MSDRPTYAPGDCIAEQVGIIRLADIGDDGQITVREVIGILLTCPVEPPKLPISVCWDRVPLRLTTRK